MQFLNILTLGKFAAFLFKIREKLIVHHAKRLTRRSDLVISTDDFPIRDWSPKKYVVEFRGMPNFVQVERFREVFFQEFNLQYENINESVARKNFSKSFQAKSLQYIIVYSIFVKNQILELSDIAQPIEIIPLSIPSYEFYFRQTAELRSNRLLFIGRDDPLKGLDFALKLSKMCGLRLTIVGSYSSEYAKQLSQLPFVDFRGSMNRSELFKIMGETALLLAPSIETFGYSIAEAINLKMNVIMSKYAGISDQLVTNEHVVIMSNFHVDLWLEEIVKSLRNLNHKYVIQPKNHG
jgi:glycosyltransferase involved in cell wall biosynthesis